MAKIISIDYIDDIDRLVGGYLQVRDSLSSELNDEPTRYFATWLKEFLNRKKWSIGDLADKMSISVELLTLILTGRVPLETFDDDLIKDFASVTGFEGSVIRLVLGHEDALPNTVELEVKGHEAKENYDHLIKLYVDVLDGHVSFKDGMNEKRELYQLAIDTLQKIIVDQRRELKFVELLKQKLESPDSINLEEFSKFDEYLDPRERIISIIERIKAV